MMKELMDDKLKKEVSFVIRLNVTYRNRIYEVIKDIKKRYGSRFCYVFATDDDTTLLLVCERKFSFYADVLAKAIKSKDKMLLDYIICTINAKTREDIREYFKSHIEEQGVDDKKEEAKKPSNTSNEIDRETPKEIMDSRQWWFKSSELDVDETEKSDDEEANIPYFIDFVKTSKDILKKYGYHEYRKYYPKVYGVNNRKTFILCHDFDINIRKMYLHLIRSNDTSVIDTMDKYCDEILHKYGAKKEMEKSNDGEENIQYFIDFVKNSKDILKKCGYYAYIKYYARALHYEVTPDTFDLFEDFDKNIRKMYSYLANSNDTSVIDTMDKYCDEILHKYDAKKEKDDVKKSFKNIIQSMIDIYQNQDITAPVKIYKIKNIIVRTHKDASSFSDYPDELDWLMHHMTLITGVITFNCDKLSSVGRMDIINSICKSMLSILHSDKFPNEMIKLNERDFVGIYLVKKAQMIKYNMNN